MKATRLVLIVLLLMVIAAGVSCNKLQNVKASIAGTVYMDNRPIAGTVQLLNEANQIVAQERTTLSGHYQIKDLSPGTYKVVYLNMQGVPWGGGTTVVVRLGRFETVDLHLSSTDRLPITE